jgi:hypothetical protein
LRNKERRELAKPILFASSPTTYAVILRSINNQRLLSATKKLLLDDRSLVGGESSVTFFTLSAGRQVLIYLKADKQKKSALRRISRLAVVMLLSKGVPWIGGSGLRNKE